MNHCLTFLIIKISRDGKRCPRFLFSICEIRILSENAKAVMQTRSDDLFDLHCWDHYIPDRHHSL